MTTTLDHAEALAADSAPIPERVALRPGLYAIRFVSNWDGCGDICTALANYDKDGVWSFDETGRKVIEYHGDKVLQAWPMSDEAAHTPYECLSTAQRIAVLEREQQALPLTGWRVRHGEVVAARSALQAVEVLIERMGEFLRDTYHYTAGDAVALADFQLEQLELEQGISFQVLIERATAPAFLGTLE